AGIFVAANAPFIVHDPASWVLGLMTPLVEPMFPRGAGLIFLSTNGGAPLLPSIVYAVLEIAALALSIVVAWRARRTSPELGAVLAVLPLFFAWRSLFSYFFLLPLLALAAVSRMPLGDPVADRARRLGGLTIFAAPSRTWRVPPTVVVLALVAAGVPAGVRAAFGRPRSLAKACLLALALAASAQALGELA